MTLIRNLVLVGLGVLASGWPANASAELVLSFDQASYTISGIGSTVQVPVYLSQTPGGPQVGVGNELLTAGLTVSFDNPLSIASVLAVLDITPSPAFDSASAGVTTTRATLAETSLAGISNLSSPLLLGTFMFTGESLGTTSISAATLTPGPSFVTAGANFLDPANIPTAVINVVPEPSSIVLALLAAGTFGIAILLRRWNANMRASSAH